MYISEKSDPDSILSVNMGSLKNLDSTNIEDPKKDREVSDNSDIMDFLAKAQTNTSPKIEDLMAGIVATLKILVNVEKDVKTTNNKIKLLENEIECNSGNIEINRENIHYNHDLILKNIENVNFVKQQQIDNNVLISGFSTKPNEEVAIQEILTIYDFPLNVVQSTKSFETKGTAKQQKKGMLFVKFKYKEDQIDFLKKREIYGPIYQSQILPEASQETHDNQLTISRCLTAENRDVINQLRSLNKFNKIYAIRYRNCCFQMQIHQNEIFIPIPSTEHLKKYFDFNRHKEEIEKLQQEKQQ